MKLSAEELEQIKLANKAKDLHKIIKEEGDKKDEDDLGFADAAGEKGDEDDDQNFISGAGDSKTKRDNIYKRLKSDLAKVAQKLRNVIKPIKTELRSLDNEVGGTEIDYAAIDKKNDKDVDVWDNRTGEINKGVIEAELQREEDNEAFIHSVKTGVFGKAKKRRRHMGQVNLGEANKGDKGFKTDGFIEKLSKLEQDRTHDKNGGIGF